MSKVEESSYYEFLKDNNNSVHEVETEEDDAPASGSDNWEYSSDSTEVDLESLPPARSIPSETNSQQRKYAFKLKQSENGNILTVLHLATEAEQTQRIRIAACCFNEQSNQLIVIDKRGNIFVFDFVSKRYWRLSFKLPKVTLVRASLLYRSYYLVGNKLGQLFAIDVDKSTVATQREVGNAAFEELTFGNRIHSSTAINALARYGHEAILLNLQTLQVSHQLEFNQARYSLKLAGYLPNSDQFFTCFSNDSIHVWSTPTLNTLRIAQPIKARNRKLRFLPAGESLPEICLRSGNDSDLEDELTFSCNDHDYANGILLAYCFTPDGNKFCLTTLDGYLLLLGTVTFDIDKMYRLRDFTLKQLVFLPNPKERIVIGLTLRGQVVMIDLVCTDHKLIVQRNDAACIEMSRDGKLLSILSKKGEVNVWSICRLYNALHTQTQCLTLLRSSFKQKKALPACNNSSCMHQDVRKLLKRERLNAILLEYGCYPDKYRLLIWTSLLELPCNGREFQQLLKLGTPPIVKHKTSGLKIKSDALHRAVTKVWSCLAQWCKVFAYADFIPQLVFPFVKQLPKNGLVSFELLTTLILNHFQLWFEFHPLPPANYLAMCENLLQRQDPQLCKYYAALDLQSQDYAWILLTNAFSEVLDEQQWLVLWDNVITEPPCFLVFVVVAYNLINREVLLRLPDKLAVQSFFREQNPIDVGKLLSKARKLMAKCEPTTHPKRFMTPFTAIPKGVYPKFLNYPSEWIAQQEVQTVAILKQHQEIDARLRHLEVEEVKIMERLQNSKKQEEHARRIKEMEKLYQDTIQREEEHITCQRKMLLLYQKEVRQRKSQVICQVQESEQRRKTLEMEKDIDALMHNIERERRRQQQEMLLAEDEIHNQELELLAQRYYTESAGAPLAQKYYNNIQKLCKERNELQRHLREMTMDQLRETSQSSMGTELSDIERSIMEIQREFSDIISSDNIGKT